MDRFILQLKGEFMEPTKLLRCQLKASQEHMLALLKQAADIVEENEQFMKHWKKCPECQEPLDTNGKCIGICQQNPGVRRAL